MTRLRDLYPPPVDPPARTYHNEPMRERLQRDIKAFLANGGQIKQCSVEEYKGWSYDPHRPAATMRDEIKRQTWEARINRGEEA